METKTVEELILRAREWIDGETPDGEVDFNPDPRLLVFLNEAYRELVDLILKNDGMDLLIEHEDLDAPYDISELGVYRTVGLAKLGSDGREQDLPRFHFRTRNRYFGPEVPAWRMWKGELKFYPTSATPGQLRLWFIPDAETWVEEADVSTFGGWDTYLTLRVAQKALAKEERENSRVDQELRDCVTRLADAIKNLNLGEPERMPDLMVTPEDVYDDGVGPTEYLPRG